jgi:hypothetical protein
MLGLCALSICGLSLSAQVNSPTMTFNHSVRFAVTPPLRDIAKLPAREHYGFEEEDLPFHVNFHPGRVLGPATDPVQQKSPGSPSSISLGLSVPGIPKRNGQTPPDTNAAVGDSQVVEWVNASYAVYNKSTGALEAGPFDGNLLWQSLGGPCYQENDGDIIAQWDKVNHRWLLAQNYFDISGGAVGPFYACVAVSTSADATGTYYEYQFPLGYGFPDYPKWGIWPTGYFQTQNDINGLREGFAGAYVCAYNSAKLIVGDRTAEQVCFLTTDHDFSLLPADVDSPTPPPANQDEFFIGSYDVDQTQNHLYLYSMHPDFANPNQSTFTGSGLADPVTVPTYTPLCPALDSPCIPQEGSNNVLDSLGDRLMYRFSYWNDGVSSHIGPTAGSLPSQHWYVNHVTMASGGQAGVRWYEFRAPVRTATISDVSLFQSGTFAPDSTNRWMASIAQDKMGDIALGYSIASTSIYDSVAATGRVPTDPLGQMETEVSLFAGTGSQAASFRWGDYSSMAIDGADGCTFWYAQEYYTVPASSTWQTRLTSFKFSGCQ